MKLLIFILLTIPQIVLSQQFVDKDYYLIDSLVLDDLSEYDRNLIDSSLTVYHKETNDTLKINIINELVENCWDDDVWPKYNMWVYSVTKNHLNHPIYSSFYKNIHASSLNNFGYLYDSQGKLIKAITYYEKALNVYEDIGDKKGIAIVLNNIGTVYENQGALNKALENYQQALSLHKKIGDKVLVSYLLNNIGYIYVNQGHVEKALKIYNESLQIQKEVDDYKGMSYSFNNIGYIYEGKKEYTVALEYFKKSLLMSQKINNKSSLALALSNIGSIYSTRNEIDSASNYYAQSLILYKEIDNKPGIISSLNYLGYIDIKENKFESAKVKLKRAFSISNEIGFPNLISLSSNYLAQIAVKQNNYKEAYSMYKLHIKMRDSTNNIKTQKATILLQSKYEYETQKAIDDLKNDKLLAIEIGEKQKQKLITYGVALGLAFLALFLGFIFNRLQITKKQKIIIEKAHYKITDSINYAKHLQNAILPSFNQISKYFENIFILNNPKDIVSGDFYWFEYKEVNNKIIKLIAVADSTGHGVPGAMVSVVCSNALNRTVNELGITEPAEILNKTRELVIETFSKSEDDVKDGMDISLCAFIDNKVIFSGANNPLWIVRDINKVSMELQKEKSTLISKGKGLIEFKGNRQSIGLDVLMKPFTQVEIQLMQGDTLYIFSDGFSDQFGGENNKRFKKKQFKKLLIEVSNLTMSDQKKVINNEFQKWKGNIDQLDDVCIIGLKPNLE